MGIKPELRKVLLIGQEGSGKTHFIGTMPKPIFLFSLDKGYATLAGEPGIRVCYVAEEDRRRPKAYREFEDRFKAIAAGEKYKWPDGKEELYATIAIDPLTCLSTFIFDHYQGINSNVDKKASYTEYQLILSKTQDILNKCIRISPHIVCTALTRVDKDELTGEIFYLADMIGSVREALGAWFDAVLYMRVEKTSEGQPKYQALTVGTRRQKAKLRIPSGIKAGVLPVEIPDYRVIKEKIDKAYVKKEGK